MSKCFRINNRTLQRRKMHPWIIEKRNYSDRVEFKDHDSFQERVFLF